MPPPSSTSWAARTARSFHQARSATTREMPPTAHAPIAIHSAVDRRTRYATEKMTLYSAELFVVLVSPGTGSTSTLIVVGRPNRFVRSMFVNVTVFVSPAFMTGIFLRSTIGLVDDAGDVAQTFAYEPFGRADTSGSAERVRYQFTGRERDADWLYYYRARYYNPRLSRFLELAALFTLILGVAVRLRWKRLPRTVQSSVPPQPTSRGDGSGGAA